ncbi:MAG: site-2 protease family protein [bacterium]|nr:site-2 protease family protein [bacterium]
MQIDLIFGLVILIVSVILHEVAHGYMANWLGDPTARLAGRLTLNPLVHIDPMGSIILPALLVFTQSPLLIGYAKPVPYNPHNLPGKWDEGLVAGAGPATNVLLVLIFAAFIRFGGAAMTPEMLSAFSTIVYINMMLALFNLIPVPPLDGSKVLSAILPGTLGRTYNAFRARFERVGILSGTLLILILFYFLLPYFSTVLVALFQLLTGISF